MTEVINKISAGGTAYNIASTAYATCTTAAGTSTKTAYINGTSATTGVTLITGTTVHVKFTNSNTTTDPTLSINGTTAKPIKLYSTTAPGNTPETSWNAGEVVQLTYDGSYWQINKNPAAVENLLNRIKTLEEALNNYDGSGGDSGDDDNDSVMVYNIAELKALDNNTAFIFNSNCWIAYKHNNYALLQDATGYITVYDSMSSYSVSTKLSAFTGTTSLYQGTIQVKNIADIATNGSVSAVTPTVIDCITDFDLVPGYYRFQNKYFETYNDGTYTWWRCTTDQCIWFRSDCSTSPTSSSIPYTFETVIFSGYQGTPPPLKFTGSGTSSSVVLLNFEEGYWGGDGGDPDPGPDQSVYSCIIEMSGAGSVVTTTCSDDMSDGNYPVKLYDGGSSLGLTKWDNGGSRTASSPVAGPTSTISPLFYYHHNRVPISIDAATACEGLGGSCYIVGLDLHFSNTTINASNFTYTIEMMHCGDNIPAIVLESGELVYQGLVGSVSGSILHVDFETPFYYNGIETLAILLKFDDSSYTSSHSIYGKVTLYYTYDPNAPDIPSNPSGPSTPSTPEYPTYEGTIPFDGDTIVEVMEADSGEYYSAGLYDGQGIGPGLMLNNNDMGYTSFEAEDGVAICSIRIGFDEVSEEIRYNVTPILCTSDGQRLDMYWDEDTGHWYWEGLNEYNTDGIGIVGNFWIQWEDSSGNVGDYHPDPIFIIYEYAYYY